MVRRVEGTTEGRGQSVWRRDVFGDEAKGTSRLAGAGTSDVSVEPWGMMGGQVWACGGPTIGGIWVWGYIMPPSTGFL